MRIIILIIWCCFFQANAQTNLQANNQLPEIKELKFLSVPSSLERIFPPNSCQENIIKLLKYYDERLSDIQEFEVYLVKQNCEFSDNTCLCFETTAQGNFSFLIIFNPKTQQASVLVSSYDFLSDSESYSMNFKIKRNEIKFTEFGITEGEGGEPEEFIKNLFKAKILKSGEVKIKSGRNKFK